MFEVLRYLLDQFRYQNLLVEPSADEGVLVDYLQDAGFSEEAILQTFSWLQELVSLIEAEATVAPSQTKTIRVLSPVEACRITADAFGFMMSLESLGVLDVLTRELVIDRLLALDINLLYKEHVVWVVYMVMLHKQSDTIIFWMEDLLYEIPYTTCH